ncbi:MAG TPA: hypothetical protein VKB88_44285 [Bryobacteraceae bacterium]|nr:hypothetical protein [Bryobacteraceae bacterium]
MSRLSWGLPILISVAVSLHAQTAPRSGMSTGQFSRLNGFVPFPAGNLWNTDVSQGPVDPNSANLIAFTGPNATVHAEFGSADYDGQSFGIPYQMVSGTQPKVTVELGAYVSEDDPGPMPIPSNALIERYPNPATATVTCSSSRKGRLLAL